MCDHTSSRESTASLVVASPVAVVVELASEAQSVELFGT